MVQLHPCRPVDLQTKCLCQIKGYNTFHILLSDVSLLFDMEKCTLRFKNQIRYINYKAWP